MARIAMATTPSYVRPDLNSFNLLWFMIYLFIPMSDTRTFDFLAISGHLLRASAPVTI
jgi:hypothetical protein